MQLPLVLKEIINNLTSKTALSELINQSEHLTYKYKNNFNQEGISALTDNQRLAYLVSRFPATYAVGIKVLKEVQKRLGEEVIETLLDVGAGPGTLLLAAAEAGFALSLATMLERDPGFIQIGKQLCGHLENLEKNWICQDVKKIFEIEPHDLVVASYSLNELSSQGRLILLDRLWKVTNKILVIVEPGTKPVFESLKIMREHLLLQGAHLVAPCPHENRCPLTEGDWCHFSARIERSSLHRKTKLAALNYEDEKFSYLIFSKKKLEVCQSRIIRHPFKGTGFVKFQLCSKSFTEGVTVTKKNKQRYTFCKKLEWGDEYSII